MKNFDHIHDINELIPLLEIKRQFRLNSLDLKPRGKGNKAARRLTKLPSFSVYLEAKASGLAPLANRIYLNAAVLIYHDIALKTGTKLQPFQRACLMRLLQ